MTGDSAIAVLEHLTTLKYMYPCIFKHDCVRTDRVDVATFFSLVMNESSLGSCMCDNARLAPRAAPSRLPNTQARKCRGGKVCQLNI